jgi:6-pyruvoyl-tetrahydropterin synthase
MGDELIIKELTFSAAHYIPAHPKCGAIHGHTFFVRNIRILCKAFVDFKLIKDTIQAYDHKLLVPKEAFNIWVQLADRYRLLEDNVNYRFDLVSIDGEPTCEDISKQLQRELQEIPGVHTAHFELYEGPNQGVKV